jgi:hypothetical protein
MSGDIMSRDIFEERHFVGDIMSWNPYNYHRLRLVQVWAIYSVGLSQVISF